MTYIDSALLDLTQWFCRQFQVMTGRTNVWLAVQLTNLSIIVYFLWAGVYFWSSDIGPRITLGLFCGGLLYVLTQTIFKEPIEAYESNACQRVAKGFRNPRRVRDAPLRISFLTLSLVLFYPIGFAYINFRVRIALLSYSLIVLTTAVLYLLACDPLPPCTGKARDWLRRLAPSRLAGTESSSRCGSAWERGTWMESPPPLPTEHCCGAEVTATQPARPSFSAGGDSTDEEEAAALTLEVYVFNDGAITHIRLAHEVDRDDLAAQIWQLVF